MPLVRVSNGGSEIPNYGAISVIGENRALDFTPTTNGLLIILTSPSTITTASLYRNGVTIAQVCNTISMPIDKGARYTTDISIRMARFVPF